MYWLSSFVLKYYSLCLIRGLACLSWCGGIYMHIINLIRHRLLMIAIFEWVSHALQSLASAVISLLYDPVTNYSSSHNLYVKRSKRG